MKGQQHGQTSSGSLGSLPPSAGQAPAQPDPRCKQAPLHLCLRNSEKLGNCGGSVPLDIAKKKKKPLSGRKTSNCLFQVCALYIMLRKLSG